MSGRYLTTHCRKCHYGLTITCGDSITTTCLLTHKPPPDGITNCSNHKFRTDENDDTE